MTAPIANGTSWSRLFVSQLPWVIATLVGFGAAWSNLDTRLKAIEQMVAEIRQTQQRFVTRDLLEVMKANADREHEAINKRQDRIERHVMPSRD